jgi:hypothetical protein
MATFDDTAIEGKLTIYDKGFDDDSSSYGEYISRSGGSFSPQISNVEPLRLECEHFLEAIRDGVQPRSDGRSGLRVVRVLEQLQEDLKHSRRAATVHPPLGPVPRELPDAGNREAASTGVLVDDLPRFAGRTGALIDPAQGTRDIPDAAIRTRV